MKRFAILAMMLALSAVPATAQRLEGTDRPLMAAGISEDRIDVEVNYSDSRVIVFASIPQPENETSGIAVGLFGPMTKQRMIRATMSGDQTIEFVAAPQVLAIGAEPVVASTVSEDTMIEAGLNAQATALPNLNQLMSPDLPAWRAAFVNLKMDQGLYTFGNTQFRHFDGGLRRATIDLPKNAPPGEYTVRAVAFRDGRVVGESRQAFTLARSGLDATLFDLSRQHGLIYGFVAVLLGVLVGAVAAWLGRK
ncbi:MAG: TIGR02186 family protein [Hyphomonadaceae bacterium]